MPIGSNTLISRIKGLMTAPVDEEIVILNLLSNHYVALDDTGRRIWDLLETPRRVDDLCRQLSQEFDGEVQQITADVSSFLTELEREGLVHVADERPP